MEKSISNTIIKHLNKYPNIQARKRLSSGSTNNSGHPDITGTYTMLLNQDFVGLRLEIEVKQPGKKPTKLQAKRLREYWSQGCVAFWTVSWPDCEHKLDKWVKFLRQKRGAAELLSRPNLDLPDYKRDLI